jgi:hypothetical protein
VAAGLPGAAAGDVASSTTPAGPRRGGKPHAAAAPAPPAPGAGRAPKVVVRLPKAGAGAPRAGAGAGLAPANAGVQKPRLTLKISRAASAPLPSAQ